MAERGEARRGMGAVYKMPDGRLRIQVRTPDGKRVAVYGKTKTEVERKRKDLLVQLATNGMVADRKTTLGPYLEQWLEGKRSSIRPATWTNYDVVIRRHLTPALGKKTLVSLKPADVSKMLRDESAAGSSPRTCQLMRAVLSGALRSAIADELITRNVAQIAKGPTVVREPVKPWDLAEARQFLEATKGERLAALWVCALTLGLRQGELLGLRWEDVDFEQRQLRVAQQSTKAGMGLPKSRASRRTLPLSDATFTALKAHRAAQAAERLALGPEWTDSGLVFVTPWGKVLPRETAIHAFERWQATAKVRRIRFHDMRHTAASLLVAAGMPLKVIQETLGHSSISMTADTYAHVLPATMREAAAGMDRLLSS